MGALEHLRRLRPFIRVASWACLTAIALLSLMPAQQMTRTGLGGHIEHVVAYAATAIIVAMTYAKRGLSSVALALLGYAGCLEFLQRFSPGRASDFFDFTMSGAGVLIGVAVFALLSRK